MVFRPRPANHTITRDEKQDGDASVLLIVAYFPEKVKRSKRKGEDFQAALFLSPHSRKALRARAYWMPGRCGMPSKPFASSSSVSALSCMVPSR